MKVNNNTFLDLNLRKLFIAVGLTLSSSIAYAEDINVKSPNLDACIQTVCFSNIQNVSKHHNRKRHHRTKKGLSEVSSNNSEKYDPLKQYLSISFKDTKPKEIDLPGVLYINGESLGASDASKSHRVVWGNQGIQPLVLSLTGPDLIVTPFNDPYIVGNSYLDINKRPNSNNVYVSFKFPEGVKPIPVSIFIEDPTGGPALGLQLIPKNVSQQVYTIVSELDHSSNSIKTSSSADYATHIQELMEAAAFGATPSGYSSSPYNLPPIISHGLKLEAIRRLSNSEGDLYVYEALNSTNKVITLDERDYDGPRVKAVSIFPKPQLETNEKATIIIFAKKMEDK